MSDSYRPLGELLVARGIITEEQLGTALEEQSKTKRMLGQTLVELGFAPEEEIVPVLGQQREIPYINIKTAHIDPEAIQAVMPKYAHHYMVMPITITDGTLKVALSDPFDLTP